MDRVPSGIEGLDKLISGGFPKGKSILIAGEPGTGKTILSLQFLLHGLRQGESCIYVSIDEKPMHVIQDALSLGWDMSQYLNNGQLQILDVSSYFTGARIGNADDALDMDKIINDFKMYIKKSNCTRLAIDPIAPLIFNVNKISEITEYIRNLVFVLEETVEGTILLTSHIPVGTSKLSQHGVEEFVTSGIITMKLVKPANKYIRTLMVRKLRGTATDLTEYSFDIVKDRGIVLRQPF